MLLKSTLTLFSILFISYTSIKNNVNTSRKQVAQSYKNATNKSATLNQIRDKFTNHLVTDIIPQ